MTDKEINELAQEGSVATDGTYTYFVSKDTGKVVRVDKDGNIQNLPMKILKEGEYTMKFIKHPDL